MSSDWVPAFDNLAASGIIDFDAPAYLLGQPARYVGHPNVQDVAMAPALLPNGTKMKSGLVNDEFNGSEKNLVQNPKWKKWLFGGTLGAAAIGFAYGLLAKKFKLPKIDLSKFASKFKIENFKLPKFKNFKWPSLKDKFTNFKWGSLKDKFKNLKDIPGKIVNFFKNIFSKKPPKNPPDIKLLTA